MDLGEFYPRPKSNLVSYKFKIEDNNKKNPSKIICDLFLENLFILNIKTTITFKNNSFAANYQELIVKYFLKTTNSNKGICILLINNDEGENVLANILYLMTINDNSNTKKFYKYKYLEISNVPKIRNVL